MADLNWSDRKFEKTCRQMNEHLRSIIKDYPADDIHHDPKSKYAKLFEEDERLLISEICFYDKMRWEDKSKSYFPYYFSFYDIFEAIKQAYQNAQMIGFGKYRIVLYEGAAIYGLRIRFGFDMAEKQIVTAYPVFAEKFNEVKINDKI